VAPWVPALAAERAAERMLVPQLGNGISRSRKFAYTSQTLDREAKEVTNARDSGKGQGQ
jgi:hypothetical protein